MAFNTSPLSDIDDPEIEAALVQMFLEQANAQLPELSEAITESDAAQVQKLAHGLRGSAATVGARQISELCEALCELAPAGVCQEAIGTHGQLATAVEETATAMADYIETRLA